MDKIIAGLNKEQIEAVTHINGPMLVIAGAGSGKTSVVTRRVAYLIAQGIKPWQILSLTFTNKAAEEMKSRVRDLTGEVPPWMGTFHAICAKLLRFDIEKLNAGYDARFTIIDAGEQQAVVKNILKPMNLMDKSFKPRDFINAISKAKSNYIAADMFAIDSWRDEIIATVYKEYEKWLVEHNLLDFDDLLLITVKMLKSIPELASKYQSKFPYILVDEYQDTNRVQYNLLRLLTGKQANLHATGDPDQSIYSWRGADYQNIMDFTKDFPQAKIVKLEKNYRSTKKILNVANSLIKNNSHRLEKNLFTDNEEGEKILKVCLQSERMEAQWVAEKTMELRKNNKKLSEIAILYRTNSQSRPIEEVLVKQSIPYQIIGGIRFYERKEIKDLLAILKILVNPYDLISFQRVLDIKKPGVGDVTLKKIVDAAKIENLPIIEYIASPVFSKKFKPKAKLEKFVEWIKKLREVTQESADIAVKKILEISGLIEQLTLEIEHDPAAEDRIDNLKALVNRADEFVQQKLEERVASNLDPENTYLAEYAKEKLGLAEFLEDVALVADIDRFEQGKDVVTLMTLHSAKGLEFNYVFITGVEEGLLPHRNTASSHEEEEERRLLYVGVTRARKQAFLTRAICRLNFGSFEYASSSKFLAELPVKELEEINYDVTDTEGYGSGKINNNFNLNLDLDFGDDNKNGSNVYKNYIKVSNKNKLTFKTGDLVRHAVFGSGKVLAVSGKHIFIQFFKFGTRKLIIDLAQIKPE